MVAYIVSNDPQEIIVSKVNYTNQRILSRMIYKYCLIKFEIKIDSSTKYESLHKVRKLEIKGRV